MVVVNNPPAVNFIKEPPVINRYYEAVSFILPRIPQPSGIFLKESSDLLCPGCKGVVHGVKALILQHYNPFTFKNRCFGA